MTRCNGLSRLTFLFVLICWTSFAYANSEIDASQPNGVRFTLAVSAPDLVLSLANEKRNQMFQTPFQAASDRFNNGEEDFIALFVSEFEKQNDTALLVDQFLNSKNSNEISGDSKNSEISTWLKNKRRQALDHSALVMKRRIREFGLTNTTVLVKAAENLMEIELPGFYENDWITRKITTRANLGFYEVYDNKFDGISQLLLLHESTLDGDPSENEANDFDLLSSSYENANDKKHPISSLLVLPLEFNESGEFIGYRQGSVIGYSKVEDTAKLNVLLNHEDIRINLPRDLSFMWGAEEIENEEGKTGLIELHSIKVPYSGPRIDSEDISKAFTIEEMVDQISIQLDMTDDGAFKWDRMTRKNLNQQIAIVMDNEVYIAPIVNEVMDSSSTITGNFTPLEAIELTALINAGSIEAPLKIVRVDEF